MSLLFKSAPLVDHSFILTPPGLRPAGKLKVGLWGTQRQELTDSIIYTSKGWAKCELIRLWKCSRYRMAWDGLADLCF
jgi:hypothetical protein